MKKTIHGVISLMATIDAIEDRDPNEYDALESEYSDEGSTWDFPDDVREFYWWAEHVLYPTDGRPNMEVLDFLRKCGYAIEVGPANDYGLPSVVITVASGTCTLRVGAGMTQGWAISQELKQWLWLADHTDKDQHDYFATISPLPRNAFTQHSFVCMYADQQDFEQERCPCVNNCFLHKLWGDRDGNGARACKNGYDGTCVDDPDWGTDDEMPGTPGGPDGPYDDTVLDDFNRAGGYATYNPARRRRIAMVFVRECRRLLKKWNAGDWD